MRQSGHKRLRFGAILSIYSKTSHTLNKEHGDKATPRAAHPPARYPRDRSCHIAPAGTRATERAVPKGTPSAPPAPLAHGPIHSPLPGGQTDLPTAGKKQNSKGIWLKAKSSSWIH